MTLEGDFSVTWHIYNKECMCDWGVPQAVPPFLFRPRTVTSGRRILYSGEVESGLNPLSAPPRQHRFARCFSGGSLTHFSLRARVNAHTERKGQQMRLREGIVEEELDPFLIRDLKRAEFFARHEFEITSGYREGDERCHGERRAVDIACTDSGHRFTFLGALLRAGFVRIGVYTAHIHVDVCGNGFPQEVLWLGGASK